MVACPCPATSARAWLVSATSPSIPAVLRSWLRCVTCRTLTSLQFLAVRRGRAARRGSDLHLDRGVLLRLRGGQQRVPDGQRDLPGRDPGRGHRGVLRHRPDLRRARHDLLRRADRQRHRPRRPDHRLPDRRRRHDHRRAGRGLPPERRRGQAAGAGRTAAHRDRLRGLEKRSQPGTGVRLGISRTRPRSSRAEAARSNEKATRKEDRMNIMPGIHLSRIRVVAVAVALAAAGLLVPASLIAPAQAATAHAASGAGPKPAIVLEHGAWADGSSWDAVIGLLQADGYTVYAPPDPLRGLANDSATLADFLETIAGPVVLVGHSYGGMVITNAATGNANVKALVYIDAFLPAQGETAFGLTAAQPGSCVGSASAFTVAPYPAAPAGDFDTYLKTGPALPHPRFAPSFANGLPAARPAILAVTQRPAAFSTGSDSSGIPAWQTIPSWSLIVTADHVIPPAEQLFMSERAHLRITEVESGHLS